MNNDNLLIVFSIVLVLFQSAYSISHINDQANYETDVERICGITTPHTQNPNKRIVGGEDTLPGQIPWQALVVISTDGSQSKSLNAYCGGSLITSRHVLSAAHCFLGNIPIAFIRVYLGRITDLTVSSSECGEQKFMVTKLSVHPDHNRRNQHNDIAILRIASVEFGQEAFFNSRVRPICLPNLRAFSARGVADIYASGRKGTVSGWGLTEEQATTSSGILQHVVLTISPGRICREKYSAFITQSAEIQFCARGQGTDACLGDSGGPFSTTVDGRVTLLGHVSYGKGCARANYPGVFIKTIPYMEWIQNEIKPNTPVATTNTNWNQHQAQGKSLDAAFRSVPQPRTTMSTTTQITTTIKPQQDSGKPSSLPTKMSGPLCDLSRSIPMGCSRNKKIFITAGFYGRQSNTACQRSSYRRRRRPNNINCSYRGATEDMKRNCNGKNSCRLSLKLLRRTANPCSSRNTNSYLAALYVCI